MPDNRRTREINPLLYPQLVAYPEEGYAPVDQGSPAQLDLGRLDNMPAGLPPDQVAVDQSLWGSQSTPDAIYRSDDALKSPLSQIPEGLGKVASAVGDDLSGLGSMLGRGLNAITPSQDTMNSIGMRLQNMGAAYYGVVPPYLQQAKIMHDMGMQQETMLANRAALAQKLEQDKLQRQQHLEDKALDIWKDQNIPVAMKKKLSEQIAMQGVPLAKNLVRLGDEQVAAEMEILAPHLPAGKLGELVNIMRQPNADLAPVEQWLNHARERKKAHGEAQMKSERFTSLLKAYQSGEMDPDGPDYDEFKQHVMEREKRQKEATEMDLKLQQMGLTKRKAEMELQAQQVMPQYGPEVNLPGGNVQRDRFDPQTGQLSQVTGNKPPASVTNIDMKQESAYKTARGKDFAKLHADADASAISAQTRIAKLDRLGFLMKGFETGGLVPSMTAVQNIGETFGIKVDSNLPAKQAFEALSNELALMMRNTGEGNGMPGNMSNADREYLVTTVPSLGKSKGGNMKIIETARALAQREVEKSKQMAAYEAKHGQLDSKFLAQWNDYVESHPMFPKVEQSSPKESKGAAPQTGPYSDPDKERRYQEWKRKQGK